MPTYKIKEPFASMPLLRTTLNGKLIGLNQSFKLPGKATVTKPAKDKDVPQATQAELKQLFESGDRAVIKVDDVPVKEQKAEKPEPDFEQKEK